MFSCMFRIFVVLLLFTVASLRASAQSCGFAGYDLSSLAELGTLSYSVLTDTYYLAVCGIVNVPACNELSYGITTCLLDQNQAFDVGTWSNVTWTYLDPLDPSQGIQYIVNGGTCSVGGVSTSFVQFVCGDEVQMFAQQFSSCEYRYKVSTPAVCNTPGAIPCTFNGVDYSSLRTVKDIQAQEDGWDFYLNICQPLQSTPGCMWENSATSVCGGPPFVADLNNIGNWKQPQWSFISTQNKSAGVQYTVTGDFIWDGANLTSVVQLVCGQGSFPPNMTVQWVAPSYVLSVETPLACGGVQPTSTCSFGGFDFSSYQSSIADWTYKSGDGNTWYLNVCGTSVTPACLAIDLRTSACISSSGALDLGNWQDPVWSYINASNHLMGVQYEIIGSYQLNGRNVSTVVQFVCNPVDEPMYASIEYDASGQAYYQYTFLTNYTCTAPQTQCGWNGIDLSSFQSNSFDWSYTYDDNSTYYISVCGPSVTPRCASVDSRTSACLINSIDVAYDIGSWDPNNPAVWSYIDNNQPGKGIQYTMTGDSMYSGANDTTVVQFVCSQTPEPLTATYYVDRNQHLVFQYVFTTNYSCGSTPTDGSSVLGLN